MTKSILILGGAGFLGQSIAKYLSSQQKFKILIGDINPISIPNVEYVHLDIYDKYALNNILKEVDYVINCVGQITNPITNCFLMNTFGITNIVNAVKSTRKKLFHISSISIYGSSSFVTENSPYKPESPYATCKSVAESIIRMNLDINDYCILRIPNLFGEEQIKGLFAYLISESKCSMKLVFNNNGTLTRHFLHISDCAEAIYLAIKENLVDTFNISGIKSMSIISLLDLIYEMKQIKFIVNYSNSEPIENIETIDCTNFSQRTGFNPKISLENFIEKSF